MRLIDADELIKGFDLCIDTADDTASVLIASTFKRIVNSQPTIEQELLIRCRDCNNWGERGLCEKWDYYISNEDFYCGCAEQKEGET